MIENINWYPGHMKKTRELIQENLKLVDAVIEVIDARIPVSSRNPIIDELVKSKPRIIVLNKSDLADSSASRSWEEAFRSAGSSALSMNCMSGKGVKELFRLLEKMAADRNRERTVQKPFRLMIVGVPNVGKSSLINRLCKGGNAGKAAVQDKPGVTRRNQWFTIGKGLELLDTPGVLWPKFEDPVVGEHLAFTGAVRDEILDIEGLSYRLLELLQDLYPEAVNTRYKTDIRPEEELKGHEILERIGRKRGMLISGGEIDTERAAVNVLDEYRGGKLGRITLEPVGRPLK